MCKRVNVIARYIRTRQCRSLKCLRGNVRAEMSCHGQVYIRIKDFNISVQFEI